MSLVSYGNVKKRRSLFMVVLVTEEDDQRLVSQESLVCICKYNGGHMGLEKNMGHRLNI